MSVDASTLEDDRHHRNYMYSSQVYLHVPEPIPTYLLARTRYTGAGLGTRLSGWEKVLISGGAASPSYSKGLSNQSISFAMWGLVPRPISGNHPLFFRFKSLVLFPNVSITTELHINREVEIKFKTKYVPSEYTHRLFSQFRNHETNPERGVRAAQGGRGSVSHIMPCLRHEPLFRPEF